MLKRAEKAHIPLANGMALATTGPGGKPAARMMLLKGADNRGFVFYTNLTSRKSRELRQNPRAALCFWWPILEQQIRIEGKIKRVSDREADAYFASRPRGSQIGAWASLQSAPLKSRKALFAEAARFEKKYKGMKVPRPPFWSGYVLAPKRIEFWQGMPDRLHERVLYLKKNNRWKKVLLYP